MIITGENSAHIAERIGEILQKNINIMNADGLIVASTDPARIGTLHQAAKDLIERDAPELDVYSGDNITGSKEGINVPICINGHTIGVVGVTGNPDELRDIALVIGEMTGIFFMETVQIRQRETEKRSRRYYWEELLFGSHGQESEAVIRRGEELGILVQKIRSVAQLYLPNDLPENRRIPIEDKLIVSLHANLDPLEFMHHHRIGEKLVLFFSREPSKSLVVRLQTSIEGVRAQTELPIYCGISGGCRSYTQISQTYTQAEKALDVAYNAGLSSVCVYESLALEILINQLPTESRAAYIDHVWRTVDEGERRTLLRFLNVYFECSGSIKMISEKLFIHKNTVQYKIRKVFELTGYDPRILNDAAILNLCVRMSAML